MKKNKNGWLSTCSLFIIFIIFIFQSTLFTQKAEAIETSHGNTPYIPVLMYHIIDKVGDRPITTTSPARLKEQLTYLKKHGYQTITPEELYEYMTKQKIIPYKAVVLTFDDGYKNNYTNAYPIIKSLNMKATLFLITGQVNGERLGYPLMSWQEAKQMQDSKVFNIESHTHLMHWRYQKKPGQEAMITPVSEHGLKHYTPTEHYSLIINDLRTSKYELRKQLNAHLFAFAYPYGAYNYRAENAVKYSGFKIVFTIHSGVNVPGDNPLHVKRINVNDSMSGKQLIQAIEHYGKAVQKQ